MSSNFLISFYVDPQFDYWISQNSKCMRKKERRYYKLNVQNFVSMKIHYYYAMKANFFITVWPISLKFVINISFRLKKTHKKMLVRIRQSAQKKMLVITISSKRWGLESWIWRNELLSHFYTFTISSDHYISEEIWFKFLTYRLRMSDFISNPHQKIVIQMCH